MVQGEGGARARTQASSLLFPIPASLLKLVPMVFWNVGRRAGVPCLFMKWSLSLLWNGLSNEAGTCPSSSGSGRLHGRGGYGRRRLPRGLAAVMRAQASVRAPRAREAGQLRRKPSSPAPERAGCRGADGREASWRRGQLSCVLKMSIVVCGYISGLIIYHDQLGVGALEMHTVGCFELSARTLMPLPEILVTPLSLWLQCYMSFMPNFSFNLRKWSLTPRIGLLTLLCALAAHCMGILLL